MCYLIRLFFILQRFVDAFNTIVESISPQAEKAEIEQKSIKYNNYEEKRLDVELPPDFLER